jgi:mannose-1-phosphate guanylyltransferase
MENLYAVILAGGSGTRLWPRSRAHRPKQLLDLVSDQTMIQQTVNRLLPLIPIERICIMTGAQHAAETRKQLPNLPTENLFSEPLGRGTAPCVALAAAYLQRRDPEAVMASLHADHFIPYEDLFREALRASYEVAQRRLLVTLGATPTYPETGYGYIERGEALPVANDHAVYRIARFTEKPNVVTARHMIETGNFSWNTGMFTWRVDVILAEFTRYLPNFMRQLDDIIGAYGTARASETLNRIWPHVKNETIDKGIMERTDKAAVIPVEIGWSDIGSWATLHDLLPKNPEGNVVRGHHIGYDTHNSLIYSNGKLIATVGLRDLVIVETDDAILICPKERAQDVKEIVEQLKKQQHTELL